MFFGENLLFLRRANGMTQERLAERMGISRQTVSKWESGDATPELGKLAELCDIFGCSLDDLLRVDLAAQRDTDLRPVLVKGFSMARYTIISSNARRDAQRYITDWAARNGLPNPRLLFWGYPGITREQKRAGLTGCSVACILPNGFREKDPDVEIHRQPDGVYAVMTVRYSGNPPGADRVIPGILERLPELGLKKSAAKGFLPVFRRYEEQNGVSRMEVFLLCQGAAPEEIVELQEKEN